MAELELAIAASDFRKTGGQSWSPQILRSSLHKRHKHSVNQQNISSPIWVTSLLVARFYLLFFLHMRYIECQFFPDSLRRYNPVRKITESFRKFVTSLHILMYDTWSPALAKFAEIESSTNLPTYPKPMISWKIKVTDERQLLGLKKEWYVIALIKKHVMYKYLNYHTAPSKLKWRS